MKTCTKCGHTKPYNQYRKRSTGSADGYQSQCKDCRDKRPDLPATVRCSQCEQHLPRTQFRQDRSRKAGVSGICKPCRKENNRRKKLLEPPRMTHEEVFVYDYQFLREQGLSNEAVARQMGITHRRLMLNTLRYDCRVFTHVEQACWDRLRLCLDRGKQVTIHDMPVAASSDDFSCVIDVALRRGLVRRVPGLHKHFLSPRGDVNAFYEAVTDGCEVAETRAV